MSTDTIRNRFGRPLGNSNFRVGPVSFGCMNLMENSRAHQKLLRRAYEQGITFFDTADLYGDGINEMLVGDALKPMRQEVLIATKVGNLRQPDGSLRWAPSRSYILTAVEKSLRRLKTDYIDLYQLHGGTIDDPSDELVEAFELLKKQGKIRWYGISSIRPNVIRQYLERSDISSVMMQYSLLDRRPEEEMLGLLAREGVGVLVRGAIAQGLLLQKAPQPYLQFTESEVAKAARAIAAVSKHYGMSPLAVALSYVYSHPAVSTTVLGIRTESQLDAALEAQHHVHTLEAELCARLRAETRDLLYEAHRT